MNRPAADGAGAIRKISVGETTRGRFTHVNSTLFQMHNQLGHIDLGRELIRKLLVALAEPSVWGWRNIHHFRDLRAVMVRAMEGMRRTKHALHALKLCLRGVADGVLG